MLSEVEFLSETFECPHCHIVAMQDWFTDSMLSAHIINIYEHIFLDYRIDLDNYRQNAIKAFLSYSKNIFPRKLKSALPSSLSIAQCHSCDKFTLWVNKKIVYPKQLVIDPPNKDMNPDIQELYIEAGNIIIDSPKGAAALLRLALQKLLIQLGKDGKNINNNIKELVAEGLHPTIQKALDLVRVIGNNAVHPGEINFDDNKEIAFKLFEIINLIAKDTITNKKEIDRLYDELISNETKQHIEQRDNKK